MNDNASLEFLAFMEAQEVARRWHWPHFEDSDNRPIPQFVMDEIKRREVAWQAAKQAQEVAP